MSVWVYANWGCRSVTEPVADAYEAFFDSYDVRTMYVGIAHSCVPANFAGDRYNDPGCWSSSILSHLSFYGTYTISWQALPKRCRWITQTSLGLSFSIGQVSSLYHSARSMRVFGQGIDTDGVSYLCLPHSQPILVNTSWLLLFLLRQKALAMSER
ncbi:hypothetical protein DFJ58DRAFT_497116 [Suillus subalutaceus]|uniref:uncharacterized protein n=1 Tax=Suillus subalutaceus TaxID=48586 RepID=UPI001B868F43|nr:uncharacterized protein DFJ58DRAFT_497116 [Suillus subalutaceus]KAG1871374.1 hypothetical protein DFJ58DRAFT_497116 [Suillus subalutaceus]